MAARIRAWLAREDGMTIPELLTAMSILAFVVTGILVVFVGGLNATTGMNARFQAQQDARLALSSLRYEVGFACSAVAAADQKSVQLLLPDATTHACSGSCSDTALRVISRREDCSVISDCPRSSMVIVRRLTSKKRETATLSAVRMVRRRLRRAFFRMSLTRATGRDYPEFAHSYLTCHTIRVTVPGLAPISGSERA